MSYQYVKVDETNKWDGNFLDRYGITKMVATYAFNPEQHVYCASITPAYEMRLLGTEPELDSDKELTDENHEAMSHCIFEADCDEVWFNMLCRDVKKLEPKDMVQGDCESLDDVADEWCSNPW